MRKTLLLALGWWLLTGLFGCLYAKGTKEITILYTGETHAMLYPCNCPVEPDGGVARRMTLIRQLKQKDPDALVLDSGAFFAGGLMDQYTQNTQLDSERSLVNLRAMELMGYDAAAIGDDEFNFGREFLEENLGKTKINFLSCNLASDKIMPYLIKEVKGIKIGLIGITSPQAAVKTEGLKVLEPIAAVKQAIEKLKQENTDIIIALSHLGEKDDLELVREAAGIDILISGHDFSNDKPAQKKIGSTILLRPSWQGRRLGKSVLSIENNKIKACKVGELRLRDKIRDDKKIFSILPRCFSDSDCKKEGYVGICTEPAKLGSRCSFTKSATVKLLIIKPSACRTCDTETTAALLKQVFPGLKINYLYYPGQAAKKMIADFGLKGLPAYLLGKAVEKEDGFVRLKDKLEKKGDFYILSPQVSGYSYFANRGRQAGKLDLFISLFGNNAYAMLELVREFNPVVHFLARQKQGKFEALKAGLEVEEDLRSVCVQKYYPGGYWDYIICRAKNINSSWWEDCLGNYDTAKIRECGRGPEGVELLKENIALSSELEIMLGPVCLLDNQEVFAAPGVPSREEFKKIIGR